MCKVMYFGKTISSRYACATVYKGPAPIPIRNFPKINIVKARSLDDAQSEVKFLLSRQVSYKKRLEEPAWYGPSRNCGEEKRIVPIAMMIMLIPSHLGLWLFPPK